jgi:photosystem II stability/assembly factor-like uncharacterized protein
VDALAIDPTNPRVIYAGTYKGLFKTTTGGTKWQRVSLNAKYIRALVIDPRNPTTIYAGTGTSGSPRSTSKGMFKSTDGGRHWIPANTGLTETDVWALAIDPRKPTTLYAGTNDSGRAGSVFKSTDSGRTWRAFGDGLNPNQRTSLRIYVVAVSHTGRVYAGTEEGFFTAGTSG